MFGLRRRIKALEWELEDLKFKLKKAENDLHDAVVVTRRHLASYIQGKHISPDAVVNGSPFETIPSKDLKRYTEENPNTLVLDIRSSLEWENGHISGAMHIPLNELEIRWSMLRGGDANRKIAVVCQTGFRSAQACELLSQNGFDNILNVEGGLNQYAGHIVKAKMAPTPIENLPGDPVLLERLAKFLDEKVRPSLRKDGGDLVLHGIEAGVARINLTGACGGCGSKESTVDKGIKSAVTKAFPELKSVEEHRISNVSFVVSS